MLYFILRLIILAGENVAKKYKVIDLFCGAGGLSLGFSTSFGHQFETVWANDFNKYAADTYNRNFGNHCIVGDIVELLADPCIEIPHADIVIGGAALPRI